MIAGYRIVDVLGAGGMGVVYRAHQQSLDRDVALKVLSAELSFDERFRGRFELESRLAASIEHPRVLPIYEAGEDAGLMFIAMRLVDGCDLRRLIARSGRLDSSLALHVVSQIADALDAAHSRGLVHCDVKPANALVAERGGSLHVYLTDFGLCVREGSGTGLTRAGGWVGTLDYLAPEQIAKSRIDSRADVYALGCVLFEALTGAPPFRRGDAVGTLWAHLCDQPPLVSATAEVPPAMDAVVLRALAKKPDERYGSAGEFVRAAAAAARPQTTTVADGGAPHRGLELGEDAVRSLEGPVPILARTSDPHRDRDRTGAPSRCA